ncbi:GTPase-associated protein 1-related protein [Streptomyces sp. NPDC088261]|uniref:GTPase-associated protein 1-related protein n=1 Tax=Streptomyces sp. NPDC088261 TaxID=3365851 RepID=UPI00382D830C
MSLAQLHYTSVPPESGGSGVRFTAVTGGIGRGLLEEAGRLLGYEPPQDAPARPSDAQLADFPQAFSHSALSGGGRLLARAVCVGAEPGGRRSAFHAHAVLLPPGEGLPGGALPITAWNSPHWAATTPDSGVPDPLDTLAASGLFYREGLIGFAASRAPWLAGYVAGLRAIAEDKEGEESDTPHQIVLVERRSADVAQWIALAGHVLPAASAARLTFTTYTRRPRDAPQRILGVLPADARGLAELPRHFRVLDCTDGAHEDTDSSRDSWAETAARLWLAGMPELFEEAEALPGGRFDPGALAAVALRAGVDPGPDGRADAAGWARTHARALDEEQVRILVGALCAPNGEDRTTAETQALTDLFAALAGRSPDSVTAPLAALVLTEAVRATTGAGAQAGPGSVTDTAPAAAPRELPVLPEMQLRSLSPEFKQRLGVELAFELRAGISADLSGTGPDTSRPVGLLRIAGILGVDCTEQLPDLADRLAAALLAAPESAYTPAVQTALEEHFELRVALLSALDRLAAADPAAATRLLNRTTLFLRGVQSLPHLRMCAEAPAPWSVTGLSEDGGEQDRVAALAGVLRAAGVSPFAEPLVLRTAVRLVWADGTPTAGEARRLLGETGSDAHRSAGTWATLVAAALGGPGDDPDAPDLAHDLLRSFPEKLEPRVRSALLLLEFAGALRAGRAHTGWIVRARLLRADAEPVEQGVLEQALGALARQLLSEERPNGELYDLIHGGDADLLAAYDRAAREETTRERLRTVPAYTADCFIAWSSFPGANPAWDRTRTALLDKVLRPVVRSLPAGDLTAVEESFGRAAQHHTEEFRAWNRPGALGRLGLALRRRTG